MNEIKGFIDDKSLKEGEGATGQKWRRAAFKVGGKTYSTFDEEIINKFNKGDYVTLNYETPEGTIFNNVTTMEMGEKQEVTTEKVEESGEVPQDVWVSKDKRLTRMAAINSANKTIENWIQINPEGVKNSVKTTSMTDLVKTIASMYEVFIWGDTKK